MAKRIEVVPGTSYGTWTVIMETAPKIYPSGKHRAALCRCGCGAEHSIDLHTLRAGKSRKCQSCSVKFTSGASILALRLGNITMQHKINPGDKFGEWTVLGEAEKRHGARHFLCRCACGKEQSIVSGDLVRKGRNSCIKCAAKLRGISRRIRIEPGDKFKDWTVIRSIPKRYGKRYFLCQCICGNEREVSATSLYHKERYRTCKPCAAKKKAAKRKIHEDFECISGTRWRGIELNAKSRRLPFEITQEDAYAILATQNFRCNLTGDLIDLDELNNASLDRIDSSKGYVEGNIQWLTKDINRLKNNYSQEHFIGLCVKVAKHCEE